MMKPYYTVALSMLVGAGLGGAAIQALHAQAKPPIYVVAEIDVTNPDAYPTDYATKMQALIKSHGGRQLAIGGIGGANAKGLTALEGTPPKRAVVQVWDSMEKLQGWRNDPQFKELRSAAAKYATWRSFAIEGQQ
jgi:uncharacterized protein (DUF1330 family)